ncbi:MAG TPA: AraC family transcriptional regulator, partial [Dehalococcoidia bacterium]|nr:AraC family transcriptional regulator [Dehalococcoidia bacterium]
MTIHRSTLATISQAMFSYLESLHLDTHAIFNRAGLDANDAFDPAARFPTYATTRLLQIAIRETGEECIVYRMMSYFDITMAHAMGYAWLASRNLHEALSRFVRYHRMLSSNVEVSLERAQGSWQLNGKLIDTGQRVANEGVLIFCFQMCRLSYGKDLVPLNVQLTRARPLDPSPILDFYRCNVEFGCPENIILFNPSDIGNKQRGANPTVVLSQGSNSEHNLLNNNVLIEHGPSLSPQKCP